MFRRLIHVAGLSLIAAALLGASQCQNNSNNGVGPNGALFVTTLAVEDANGNAASSFTQGQQIQFVLSVRNRSTSSQTVSFNTSEQSNFAVFESGSATEVWTWSLTQAFSQTLTTLTWQPDETKTFTVTWNQVNDSNQLVFPGNYEAMAGLTCANSSSSSSSSSSSTANNCMPTAVPGSGDLVPSVYVSTLVPFTVQ